jgi:hypothetical protein
MGKKCCKCGEVKSLDLFYWDSHSNNYKCNCKECCKLIERIKTDKFRNEIKKYKKSYYQKNRIKIISDVKLWQKTNPGKVLAQSLAKKEFKNITKPCEICGTKTAIKHHYDYTKPLEVIFLCHRHHKQVHSGLLNLTLEK